MADTCTYEEFLTQYSSLLEDFARLGWTASEAYSRFATLYPQVPREFISRAIDSGQWSFVGRQEHLVNNTMTAAALWYAVGFAFDLDPDPAYTALTLDPVIMQDIPRLFEASGVSAERVSSILGRIGAALKYTAENPYTILDEATYDELLENLPEEVQGISDGVTSWPPARAIVEDRMGDGSWTLALLRVGVCPPDLDDLGLSLASNDFSDRAFRNALGEFLSYCIRYDRKPTVMLYGSWSVARSQLGRVPLLGAVRGKYGSWHRALKLGRRMVNDALKLSTTAAVPAHAQEPAPVSTSLSIEEINAQGIAVVESLHPNHPEREENAWIDLATVMANRLEELPWSQSLRVYYLSPEALEAEDYTPYVRILRSPSGYFCELTAPESFAALVPTYDTAYLDEQGWYSPRINSQHGWSRNFFDVTDAAVNLIDAMRLGMGCDRPDYFQSDDPSNSPEVDAAHPATGSIPMIVVPNQASISVETD